MWLNLHPQVHQTAVSVEYLVKHLLQKQPLLGYSSLIGADQHQRNILFHLISSNRFVLSESFFVEMSQRKSGAGLKLLRTAEKFAKDFGAPGIFISAPYGGTLAEVLPMAKYRETNRVFYKDFRHG